MVIEDLTERLGARDCITIANGREIKHVRKGSTPMGELRSGQQRTNTSLDKTSHPGRPGLDELVPSRYALKVGEIDVMVVSDGIIGVVTDGVIGLPSKMLAHNADPAVRAAWMEDKFLPPDTFGWALNAVVVRSGGRTFLIDAGFGEEYPGAPQVGRWAKRLEAAGIEIGRASCRERV